MVPYNKIASKSQKKYRVLFLAPLGFWDDFGPAVHFREIIKGIQEEGGIPIVLCLNSARSIGDLNIKIKTIKIPHIKYFFQLSWNFITTINAVKEIMSEHIDVIYARLNNGMVACLFASLITKKPLIIEINGLSTEDMSLWRGNGILTHIVKLWEKIMLNASHMIVAAPGYANYYKKKFNIPANKFCIVTLGVDLNLYNSAPKNKARSDLLLPEGPLIVWMGNMAIWQGLEIIAKAIPLVINSAPNVHFLFIGDGLMRPILEEFVEEYRVKTNCIFTGHKRYLDLPKYLTAADICITAFPPYRGKKGSISSLKTLSYLAVGRPIVTSDMDEMATIIETVGVGYAYTAGKYKMLADRILDLLNEDAKIWEDRCRIARKLAEKLGGWRIPAQKISFEIRERFV